MGPRTDLEGCGKSRPPPGLVSRTDQPVASLCSDWAIPVPIYIYIYIYIYNIVMFACLYISTGRNMHGQI